MNESLTFGATWVVFAATYAGLAWGKLPGLRTDRAGIAWAGSAAVLALGLLGFDHAVDAVDFATIALLLGMMVVVGMLRLSGFFDTLAGWALARTTSPSGLLAVTMGLSGVLSAALVNDVICLALTPVVLQLAGRLRLDPKPHLVGLALASNIGSAATLTGNPQNMIIGNLSHIGYVRFACKLAPLALVSLAVGFLTTWWVFRASLRQRLPGGPADAGSGQPAEATDSRRRPDAPVVKALLVTLGTVALFFAGMRMEVVALSAAAVLLLGRTNPEAVYGEINWKLLVMFAGLFVVVRAFEAHVVRTWHVEDWAWLKGDPVGPVSAVSAALSNLVSNVPAVLLFKPVVPALPEANRETAWLALAMSSTLAGNLTVLGSVANLIVVETARGEGVDVSFWDYCKAGVPVTVLTLVLGGLWLRFAPY